jgi:hypothetical protein
VRKDREKVIQWRKAGKSYKEIESALKVPRSTLSGWFGKEDWSEEIKQKLIHTQTEVGTVRLKELNKIRGKHLAEVYENARNEAYEELDMLKYNPLFIAALMLYWGEGDKTEKGPVRLTNTDPKLLKLYVFFLKNVCNIPLQKIRVEVLVYPDLNEKKCREYWSKAIGLSLDHFTKSILIQGRHKTRRLSHGVCIVLVSSKYLKEKMLEWIRLLPDALMNREYYESILATRI